MENFNDKFSNSVYIFVLISLVILSILLLLGVEQTEKVVEQKPIDKEEISKPIIVDKTNEIAILTWHRVATHEIKEQYFKNDEWVNDLDVFEEQMKYLYDNGYKTLSSEEFYCWYQKKCEYPKKTVMLTFDDGDVEIYYNVLPILKRYNFNAISFVIGSKIKDVTDKFDGITRNYIGRDLISEIKLNYPNLEFQSHTYDLHNKTEDGKVYAKVKSSEELFQDFINNQEFGFTMLAYPFGIYDDKLRNVVKESNYKLAFRFYPSLKATRNDPPYDINRIKINGYMTLNDMINKLESDNKNNIKNS